MANEIQLSFRSGATVYYLIRNQAGQIWNVGSDLFENYATGDYTQYDIALVEQGSASGYYVGSFIANITTPGLYNITAKQQIGGSPAETDPTIAVGELNWNGLSTALISDTSTSGQVGRSLPIKPFRGQMLQNFVFPLVGNADHITPFTSGVVSGQISRDGGSFGALQSGAFTEIGLGFYNLQALTSGDLLANTVALVFTANGISGGAADPCKFTLYLQRTSGQVVA